jgi:hypothetical protein
VPAPASYKWGDGLKSCGLHLVRSGWRLPLHRQVSTALIALSPSGSAL